MLPADALGAASLADSSLAILSSFVKGGSIVVVFLSVVVFVDTKEKQIRIQ